MDPFLEKFPWDSEDQKKSVMAFVQWRNGVTRKLAMAGVPTDPDSWWLFLAFYAQKEHEAAAWWRETIGSQISALQDELKKLQNRVDDVPELARQVAHLTHIAGTLLPS